MDGRPFSAYPSGGRALLDRPKGDVARRGYGRQVLAWCGFRCAYCDLDMSVFEGWLQLSVDHVIPQQAAALDFPAEWIHDQANLVACCRSCNDLFNRDPVVDPVPATLDAFFDLRDSLFVKRRGRILGRRAAERQWFDTNVVAAATSARGARPAVAAGSEPFSRTWLESAGFTGFSPVTALQASAEGVPPGPGVYVMLAPAARPGRFLETSAGGWFKGKDPTVPVDLLRNRWNEATVTLYLGKATSLRSRLRQLVRFGEGAPVGHWGGRYLWQVEGSPEFLVAWLEDEEPEVTESRLLGSFVSTFGALPFANIQGTGPLL